ncbi:hypothetical protein [Aureibaculum luteum]|uniref:hypothetical protein n=1 Tax=Aureibaculum luteum TaxID=1548456 RepID=UPI0013004808|nr:hypothetical protein [Aureibaculum luteum]
MKNFKFIIVFLFTNFIFSQQLIKGELSDVKTDGLHEILVPNEIRSFSNSDLSDFRILDISGNEVPYFIRQKSASVTVNQFIDYEIISKKTIKDSVTLAVIKNPKKTINQLVLQIANYAGSKSYRLLGSNDQEEWFGLENNTRLSGLQDSDDTKIFKKITFPINAYKYIKIIFDDKNSLPINIVRIGGTKSEVTNEALLKINFTSKEITEIADEKITKIHFLFKNREIINQILFNITAPDFYNRKATLYKTVTKEVKGKEESYRKNLAQFYLNSNSANSFNISEIFENDFFIEIENNDNAPIEVSEILFFQDPIYIIASLKTNEKFTIKAGDKALKTPQYDLSYFKSNISSNLPKVTITNIIHKSTPQSNTDAVDVFWKKSWFMWLCISLAGIVILYFTSSLLKDLKKEK